MPRQDKQLQRQRARIRYFVNEKMQVQTLLRQMFQIDIDSGLTFRCPFHDDNRKSAKLFDDNAFWCFACQVQYTPYRMLRQAGYDLDQIAAHIPPDFRPDLSSEIERKERLERLKLVAFNLRAQHIKHGDLKKLNEAWVAEFCKTEVLSEQDADVTPSETVN